MLGIAGELDRADVIEQYAVEQNLSRAKRNQLLGIAAGSIPWFLALSIATTQLASVSFAAAIPPLVVCDPAFVAEMPGSN